MDGTDYLASDDPNYNDVHVSPIEDLKAHIIDGTRCWCVPTIQPAGRTSGRRLILHHALDGRDLIERHGLQ
jgi:hypothetical protein